MNPLEQAIDKIESGWCTGSLVSDGKVCAVGAIASVELDVDMRLIDRASYEVMDREERHKVYELEDRIYNQIDGLKSVRVLADEIKASGFCDDYIAAIDDEDLKQSIKNTWRTEPSDLIITFNDSIKDKHKVMEMFKFAAKRYDEPE